MHEEKATHWLTPLMGLRRSYIAGQVTMLVALPHSFWLLVKYDAKPAAMFYLFINLNPIGRHSDFYIVPRKHVAKYIDRSGDWYSFDRTEQFKESWHLFLRTWWTLEEGFS